MPSTSPAPANDTVEVNGAAIRARRKFLGQTLTALAPRVPMSVGYLSQVERGHRTRMSPARFRALADALGVGSRHRHTLLLPKHDKG
jgi:transcriptional regulator with XRE-family HTH domain